VLPDYRPYDSKGESRFLQKYRTEVMVGATVLEDGTSVGGRPNQIPKINNPELFQAEMAPLIVRHIRNEPIVVASIPKKTIVDLALPAVPMDEQHRRYYARWQEVFAEWWQKKEEEEEGREAGKGELLTKITYLINASTIPHFMLEPILKGKDEEAKEWAKLIGKYKGPVTAKMLKCRELIREAKSRGDKTLVASTRKANLKLGQAWCEKARLPSMIVDGDISLKIDPATNRSPRHTMVEEFRNREYDVMWAGMLALAEGMNIPEANWGLIMDYTWKPADPRQFIGRMIRPQQTKTVYTGYLMHEGTIDEYMAALCYLKGRAGDEGIDYMEFSDLTTDMIPDIHQYADSIVDGTQQIAKQKMWLAVDFIRKNQEEEGE
jgi:SNF2 family DNA or RNA helicase